MKKPHSSVNQNKPLAAGFADGYVIHNRRQPQRHRFKYNMCWCLFDVDDIDHWMGQSKLWKYNAWSLFCLRDRDYIKPGNQPINLKIKDYLSEETGARFSGNVFLFTHPRFMGQGFNSVNFYFCYQAQKLAYIVSEITNTPWGEKHLYLHDCDGAKKKPNGTLVFDFKKQFHVSPFITMDIDYCWEFLINQQQLTVKMQLYRQNVNEMNVILDTKITPLMENNINRMSLKRPFQPMKMLLGIYWQAFKLWLKKIPFYSHP